MWKMQKTTQLLQRKKNPHIHIDEYISQVAINDMKSTLDASCTNQKGRR